MYMCRVCGRETKNIFIGKGHICDVCISSEVLGNVKPLYTMEDVASVLQPPSKEVQERHA
jgi:hypothetical protein